MTFEVLTENEALKKWDAAILPREKKGVLTLIADLTCTTKGEVKRWLKQNGRDANVWPQKKKPEDELMAAIEEANAPEPEEVRPIKVEQYEGRPIELIQHPAPVAGARTARETIEALLRQARENVLKWQAAAESYETALKAIQTAEEVLA